MKVILVAVTSIDGKSTKWGDPNIYKWTSNEDHDQFFSLVTSHNLVVMGSKTYTAARSVLKLAPGRMTIVMTRTPEKYSHETIPGQLEFTGESAREIVEKFKDTHNELLLTGGAETNLLFLKENLFCLCRVTHRTFLSRFPCTGPSGMLPIIWICSSRVTLRSCP